MKDDTKTHLARALGVSRSTLYYASKKEDGDWKIKTTIEELLRVHPSYGSRRVAGALNINRKRAQRVMRTFGIKPYRRRGRKWRRKKKISVKYANLLLTTRPSRPHHIWAADFTEVWAHGRWIYIATVIDLYTRAVVGVNVSLKKGTQLTLSALYHALWHHPPPSIFHSDNGREYDARVFMTVLEELHVLISRSHPGCPWENGYQESFYDKFKVDLGDPNRFSSLGELVAEIYRTIWTYNHTRIHSALNMPPQEFAKRWREGKIVDKSVS